MKNSGDVSPHFSSIVTQLEVGCCCMSFLEKDSDFHGNYGAVRKEAHWECVAPR